MHFDPTISLGAAIGWTITALGFAYAAGKFVSAFDSLGKAVARLETAHTAHCEDDIKRFTSLGEQVTQVANARR